MAKLGNVERILVAGTMSESLFPTRCKTSSSFKSKSSEISERLLCSRERYFKCRVDEMYFGIADSEQLFKRKTCTLSSCLLLKETFLLLDRSSSCPWKSETQTLEKIKEC